MLEQRTTHRLTPTYIRLAWEILKIAGALALLVLVLRNISLQALADVWTQVSYGWLLVMVLSFYATIFVWGYRYYALFGEKVSYSEALTAFTLQTVLSNLVATSLGAISLVTYLRSRLRVQISEGLASMLWTRAGDLAYLTLFLAISSARDWQTLSFLGKLYIWFLLLLTLGVVGLFLSLIFRKPVLSVLSRLIKLNHGSRFAALKQKGLDACAALLGQNNESRYSILPLLTLAGLAFILMFTFSFAAMRTFRIAVDPWSVMLVLCVTQITAFVPIHVLGGLGTFDLTSLFLYELLGYPQALIAPAIIGTRIVYYLLNVPLVVYLAIAHRSNGRKVVACEKATIEAAQTIP